MNLPHAVSQALSVLFAWPGGIVVGDVLSAFFWLPVQWAVIHVKLATHHAAMHARLDAQDAVLDEIRAALGLDLHADDDSNSIASSDMNSEA